MTENIENLILEHLRVIRSEVTAMRESIDELKARMSSLEAAMIAVKREVSIGDEVDGRQQVSLDRIVKRIERIERRLELHE